MIYRLFFIFIFFSSLQTNAQKFIYKSRGNITDSENHYLSSIKVREMLGNNEKLLNDYNEARSKKTVGNVLIVGGFGLLAADLMIGLSADVKFPSTLTYLGAAAVIVAIPVKIGFTKKIKRVVEEYNGPATIVYNKTDYRKIELITNSKGLGLRVTLN